MYIAVINYNMGNIKSVANAFLSLGINIEVTCSPEVIMNASGVVLPGVGAFHDAVKNLKDLNLYNTIKEVIKQNRPFLGICIGLQVLFECGTEGQICSGLGIFRGNVEKIPPGFKIPHMGWNGIKIIKKDSKIFKDIKDGESFYFVHSYSAVPQDLSIISSTVEYGSELVSSIEYGNTFGLQFHPEKSSLCGLKILNNFADMAFNN
ncbi:MAG: imidazole glycerol phosphate synthase subunit HisH [Actinobacteria bacterium]|nr:imidazole glycerol phosphate synthase subunit HisH [Actinomycetota bacterium]